MDFNLSVEQVALQTAAREFADHEMAPFAKKWDEEHIFPLDTLRKAASLGFAALYVRGDVGGSELTRLDGAIIFEALANACPSTAAYLSIHNMVGSLIDTYGSESLRQHWLPKFATLEVFSSYCLTEPNAGSDAANLKTRAVREGDEYVINGAKAFISGGSVSDVYVCMVRTSDHGAKGITCVLIEKDRAGISFGKLEDKLGWHSQPTSMVFFDNCRIPITNRIGEEGQGFKIALSALDGGRINIAACSLGGADACLTITRDYLQKRTQFNQKLSDFQYLQFTMADMLTELEASRLMVYRAASMLDNKGPEANVYSAMAKRLATDFCFDICNKALQLHGGYGYLRDYPIEKYLRDLRVHQILEGTNEIMRMIIARSFFGK